MPLEGKNWFSSSLRPRHLVYSTWHTVGTQNYWISEWDWLTKNVEMTHSGRMSQARLLGLASYFAQVGHRRHVKQILRTFIVILLIMWYPIKVEVLILWLGLAKITSSIFPWTSYLPPKVLLVPLAELQQRLRTVIP